MPKGENSTAERMANEYRIWCAAKSVGWDCTMHDIASDTGINYSTVQKTCKRKGWTDRLVSGNLKNVDYSRPVDVIITGINDGKYSPIYR